MRTVILEIPPKTLSSIKIPRNRLKEELLQEPAFALYRKGALSFIKAKQLSNMGR
jgi:predicted HTH domain antitoxin